MDDFISKNSNINLLTGEEVVFEDDAVILTNKRLFTDFKNGNPKNSIEIGLVDELGNLEDAIAHAESLIGLEDAERVFLPKMKDPFEQLIEDLTGVKSNIDALNLLGAEDSYLKEVLEVKKLVESGEVIQTRMPFNLHID